MSESYLKIESVQKLLHLRNKILNKDISDDLNVVDTINDFFEKSLIYISFYGIDDIRIILNYFVNFIFDYFHLELHQCDDSLLFQIIGQLDYYPHLDELDINNKDIDFIDYLNIQIRRIGNLILTNKQIQLYRDILLKNQIIYSAPTSYGKTTICLNGFMDLLIVEHVNNLLIIVPTKALINEYKRKINEFLKQKKMNINIVESAYSNFQTNKKTIYVFTQERVLLFFNDITKIKSIDYILIDEAQSMSYLNNRRTPILLKAISLFKNCPKIYLTPFVKNFNENILKKIDEKSSCNEYVISGEESLVSNNKFIIDLYNSSEIEIYDITFNKYNKYKSIKRMYGKKAPDADFLNIIPIIDEMVCRENKTIIFTTSLNNSIDWPNLLKDAYYFNYNLSKRMKALITHLEKNIHKDFILIDYLKKGIAFHNSYLDNFTKRQIEYIFTEENGIRFLFCTNTISQGVNFSAKNIFAIVHSTQSDNPSLDFVNLLGRAARLKYNRVGNLFFVKTTKTTKYEKIFFESNINLNINFPKISEKNLKNIENVELRSYIADSNIENSIKNSIFHDNKLLINELNLEVKPIDQMNYSINQSDIKNIEKKIKELSAENINKYVKFYNSYDATKEFITFLKKIYNWEYIYQENNKKKRILNVDFIATIITKLIQGNTINGIINYNINNNKYTGLNIDVKKKFVSRELKMGYEPLVISNKFHMNVIIINSLFDVQSLIEFDVKKYIQDFYYRVNKIYNIGYEDKNVENFIDFSTIEKKKIDLMNLGIVDTFAINDLVKKSDYKEIISSPKINIETLLQKVKEIEGDESPLYYAVKDII